MNFNEFLEKVNEVYKKHQKHLRRGQTIMNVLYETHPKKYEKITQTDYDCFYNDSLVNNTLKKLEEEWQNE